MGPEALGVISLDEMAELVHHEIVQELGRQEDDAVIKVQVPATLTRARPPAPLLTDAHPADAALIELVEVPYPLPR